MTREARDWRIERFEGLSFTHGEAVALADSRDKHGVPVYWGDVENALKAGATAVQALELFVENQVPTTALVYAEET